ncbi:MAG: 30S ribosome-binding factor RbfA [Chloroflexi bacterium]|nr:30S ribosome-binding factor RbfA [Chloroflexota bacterium]
MSTRRQKQFNELLLRELNLILQSQVADPRLAMATVTQVKISPDLRNATLYVTNMDPELSQAEFLRALNSAAPYMRRELGKRVQMRLLPSLYFRYDHSFSSAQRIMDILESLHAEEPMSTEDKEDEQEPDQESAEDQEEA